MNDSISIPKPGDIVRVTGHVLRVVGCTFQSGLQNNGEYAKPLWTLQLREVDGDEEERDNQPTNQ